MIPTISVPLPVLQHILALTRVAGENTKGKIADEVQGLIDEYTTKLENQLPYGAKGEENANLD